jgi:hypothetical protein
MFIECGLEYIESPFMGERSHVSLLLGAQI